MQAFSYMQRNIDDQKNIRHLIVFILSIFYEVLTTIFPFFPPMLGLAFWFFLNSYKERKNIILIYILFYTLLFEIDHNIPIFSTFLLYLLLYPLFFRLFKIISNSALLKILSIIFFYISYPMFLFLLHKIFNIDLFEIGLYYIYYILLEIFIVLVVG